MAMLKVNDFATNKEVNNYNLLTNLPQILGVTLTGNRTAKLLGVVKGSNALNLIDSFTPLDHCLYRYTTHENPLQINTQYLNDVITFLLWIDNTLLDSFTIAGVTWIGDTPAFPKYNTTALWMRWTGKRLVGKQLYIESDSI